MTPPCCLALLPIFSAGWGHPALRGNKNHRTVGAGQFPARDITETAIYRVICRDGICRPLQSSRQRSLTGKPRGRAMLAPTSPLKLKLYLFVLSLFLHRAQAGNADAARYGAQPCQPVARRQGQRLAADIADQAAAAHAQCDKAVIDPGVGKTEQIAV